ncbi:MAG: hypothetical protein OEL83_08405 [Desulforhopalus sp.]|nr:hypothetical protein [Desulforhopalus sp.]
MKKLLSVVVTLAIGVFTSLSCFAETPASAEKTVIKDSTSSGLVTYEEPGTMVRWELLADGSDWERLFASGEADLVFGDAQDVRTAKQAATLRAKAELAKFLKERITDEETLEQITKKNVKTTAGNDGQSTEATRHAIETIAQKISNQADELLRGVVVLEEKVDPTAKMVRITVGVSRKSMRIAGSVAQNIKTSGKGNESAAPSEETSKTTKRSPMYNNF